MHVSPESRLQGLWQDYGNGRLAEAEQGSLAWQAEGGAPASLGLLRAAIALARQRPAEAAGLYRALADGRDEVAQAARLGLAAALSAQGDEAGAEQVLHALVALAPNHFMGRLRLGELLQARGQAQAALHQFYGAVVHAQRQGRWLDDATTAPSVRPRVRQAMAAIDAGRRGLFLDLLRPLQADYGRDALARVERGLLMYLGELPADYAEPSQRPTFFYVPGVPAQPYLPRALFPWLEELEAATADIRAEMLASREQGGYSPFLGVPTEQLSPGLLNGSWDAYFFYRHGEREEAHARQCPLTAAALERTPLVRIRDHAPEICFSVLAPGAHILPHRGVTNTRLTAHLPLLAPPDCALLAGGQLHAWREGEAMVFDDTFEHEAWNRSGQTRVIVLMDTWNPYLEPVEREAVTRLVEAIGDFNAVAA